MGDLFISASWSEFWCFHSPPHVQQGLLWMCLLHPLHCFYTVPQLSVAGRGWHPVRGCAARRRHCTYAAQVRGHALEPAQDVADRLVDRGPMPQPAGRLPAALSACAFLLLPVLLLALRQLLIKERCGFPRALRASFAAKEQKSGAVAPGDAATI